jgi:monofunctional chorismate mutase
MKIEDLRNEIDIVDSEIIALLKKRTDIVKQIGQLKAKTGLPILDADRESKVLEKLLREDGGVLGEEQVLSIFRCIMNGSRQTQAETISGLSREREAA